MFLIDRPVFWSSNIPAHRDSGPSLVSRTGANSYVNYPDKAAAAKMTQNGKNLGFGCFFRNTMLFLCLPQLATWLLYAS